MAKSQSISVPVKLKHIQIGKRGSSFACPVAIALREAFGMPIDSKAVAVSSFWARIQGTLFQFNKETEDWVRSFDSGGRTPEFTAVMEAF